ncbi:MAG: hypothetical protein BWK73_39555 [Thiothrix lacustris]|uniref:Uncharacterized protein n=1 Tax=Thiothrix lacustris TaxID=525917 RepID=A0A1Y1QE42_9GAMM|nr:MAG: hypothetical protein BWK73_39555 [Thiothrix lacustris]
MKLPSLSQPIIFYGAGVLSTAASVSGVFSYLMVENNAVGNLLSIGGVMSVGGSVGLGLSIYFGWEVAFNHKDVTKRMAAGLIATSAATLSGYTIYQNTVHPIMEQARTAQVEQATRAVQQQETNTATLKQQQADLRQQIADLRQQNTTDAASMTALQASDKKGADWQAGQLRKGIETRHAEIAKLSERVENYTQRLTTTPESKTETDNQPTTTTDKPVVSWAMLARASMYEVMTALFLLFGSWYKTARKEEENAQAAALHVAIRTAQETLHTLQTVTNVATTALLQANTQTELTIARALECQSALTACRLENQSTSIDCRLDEATKETKEIHQSDILLLIKNKRVGVDTEGRITDEKLMELTGWGTRKAKKAKETAFEQGFLDREVHGKGFVYFYPTAPQLDLSNVIPLTARNV